jgi:hypothetical protein
MPAVETKYVCQVSFWQPQPYYLIADSVLLRVGVGSTAGVLWRFICMLADASLRFVHMLG